MVRWFGAAAAVAVLAGSLWAQGPLEVNVHLVNVAFTARDAKGALVGGLTKEQMRVSEDAVPQRIAYFSEARGVPLTLGLIVDVSGSQDHFEKQHRRDLEVFLESVLRPEDKVFLVCFGNRVRLVSDETNAAAAVLERLKVFQDDGGKRMPELGPKEDRDLGTAFYDSIFYSVTEKLVLAQGRRALLVFSDGEDNSSSHNMMETIEAAQRANVQVYTIRYTEEKHGRLTARNKYGIGVMERVAKDTGAASLDAKAMDPREYFQQIGDDLRSSYELAYYPTNAVKDDTFRKITIESTVSGLKIRARTGYFSR